MTGNTGGPMTLAKTGSTWSHDRGERQPGRPIRDCGAPSNVQRRAAAHRTSVGGSALDRLRGQQSNASAWQRIGAGCSRTTRRTEDLAIVTGAEVIGTAAGRWLPAPPARVHRPGPALHEPFHTLAGVLDCGAMPGPLPSPSLDPPWRVGVTWVNSRPPRSDRRSPRPASG